MKTIKLKVSGMHCKSCEMLIKDALEEEDGIKSASADMKKEAVNVLFNEEETSAEKIKKIIAELGYKAE